jgi:hypothetical protein
MGEPEPTGQLGSDAPDALVCGQALADQLSAGLRSWTDGQHQHAGCSAAARDEVHAQPDHREVGR